MSDVPSPNVGTDVLFENDRVRVWEVVVQPGQEQPLHQHTNGFVLVYVTPGLVSVPVTAIPGAQPRPTRKFHNNFVGYFEVGKSDGAIHSMRNDGDEVIRQIIVELKGPSASDVMQEPQVNGRRDPA